ncbi:LysR family transcriptional regulator [Thalassotalea profundi]|uniref:LysR family transcriptional regulator n=1 Tax=Thalassotalea profundi TaxID=2036687 RepID=A0ABQ3IRY0_9GAMM|nr:LysR family transcriptional regulator [Thalassotalea profundi]GHE89950.1 LysR family transcriptional regulator [Thalassotalea profundi]
MDIVKSQLSISHLKMMCELERQTTVKAAAQALFISQPALTNRIREAERRLNTPLFIRRGRKLVMSNAGKRLLVSAKKILEELARAEYDIERFTDGIDQVLRIGIPHYASFVWLPKVIEVMNEKCPTVELEITAQAAVKPLIALEKGDIDMAMFSSSDKQLVLDNTSYRSDFLVEDELVACISSSHKKSNNNYLIAQDFLDETYVTNSTVAEKDREYELFFKPESVIPRKTLQVGFKEAIIELVNANLGISIFSKRQITPYLKQYNIKTIPLGEYGLKIYWHLVYLNQNRIEEPASTLGKLLKKEITR